MPRLKSTIIATGLAVGLGVTTMAVTGSTPAAADTPPSLESASIELSASGGLTPFVGTICEVHAVVTDESPSDSSAYSLDLYRDGAKQASYENAVTTNGGEALYVPIPCDELQHGASYDLEVLEAGQAAPERLTFDFSQVDHPTSASMSSIKQNGADRLAIGKPTRITFQNGAWEDGTSFSTQVWVSKGSEFTSRDSLANTRSGDDIVGLYDVESPVLEFTVPPTAEGKFLWYSVLATKPGEAPYRLTFSAIPIKDLPQVPKSWVKRWGAKVGQPEVGTAVSVKPPVRTQKAKTKTRVEYQWFEGGKINAIEGASRKTYLIPEGKRDYSLLARVTVVGNNHGPRVKWYRFGTVS